MVSSPLTCERSPDPMPMKPLAGLFLALACVLGIAATGSVFELSYGDPDLGVSTTGCPKCLCFIGAGAAAAPGVLWCRLAL